MEVKTKLSEQEICALAAERGVRVYGISEYYISGKKVAEDREKGLDRRQTPVLLLGYGKLTEAEIKDGLEELDGILEEDYALSVAGLGVTTI